MKKFALAILAGTLVMMGTTAAAQTDGLDNPARKAKVLAYLKKIGEGPKILSGQNVGHADGNRGDTDIRSILDKTGKLPAVLGMDLGFEDVGKVPEGAVQFLIDYWKNGGLVALSIHPGNPFTGKDSWDVRTRSLDELTSPGTEPSKAWMRILDNTAQVLDKLKKAGVVVLWRPLHEMNGGWFWWGGNQNGKWTPEAEYKRLWVHMYNYFTQTKGLDNLLWVYSPNCRDYQESTKPMTLYYPGPAYVDVAAQDCYTDDLSVLGRFGSYTDLVSLGKPVVLAEFGPKKVKDGSYDSRKALAIKQSYPRFAYILFWHSYSGGKMALGDQQYPREFMHDPSILSVSDVNWRE